MFSSSLMTLSIRPTVVKIVMFNFSSVGEIKSLYHALILRLNNLFLCSQVYTARAAFAKGADWAQGPPSIFQFRGPEQHFEKPMKYC